MIFIRPLLGFLSVLLLVVAVHAAAYADCDEDYKPGAIFFVTDRAPLPNAPYFSGERGKRADRAPLITYGIVSAPVSDQTLHLCANQDAFVTALRKRFPNATLRSLLIYVHGYYRTFIQGAETAATIAKSDKFPGPIIYYSWPSKATSRLTYMNDESNANWSMPHFVELLKALQTSFPNTTVSFVSHSMGGRFAATGLEFVHNSPCPRCLGRSVFYAPDVDSDRLYDLFGTVGLCAAKPVAKLPDATSALVTLYVSNRDTALRDSQAIHGHQRAGEAGTDLILCSGVDTIDVSYIKGSDSAGHTYQVYPQILTDGKAAFAGYSPTSPRRNLKVVTRPGGVYYEMQPQP